MNVGKMGCVDRALNPWDMDASTATVRDNKGEWTLRVDVAGNATDFAETHTRE